MENFIFNISQFDPAFTEDVTEEHFAEKIKMA